MVLSGDEVLFERNPDVPVVPASTMKLLTATAVLHELDPQERLRTPVLSTAPVTDGVVDGDLFLLGGGDPVLGTADWAAHFDRQPRLFTPMERLADRVVAAGVHEVRGRVVGDDGRYDRVRYVPTWPSRYVDDNETGPLSALFVNDGFAVWDKPDPQDTPWDDPPRDAAAMLTTLLRQRGVVVAGDAAAGAVPQGATEIAGIDSPTVAQLVSAMLTDSDNGTAELFVKELGRRRKGVGSSEAGTQAVLESLGAQGLPLNGVVMNDGSGLDHGDHVTCRLLATILERAGSSNPINVGLPIAAQTGTLYKRFLATPVAGHLRAKTGSITGVMSLAGFADGPQGPLTFVHVLNGIGRYADARAIQDALGAALVGLG
jgi:D-alanyl-D-alanine carboxypeptidase/D-alanyl-D-alanine-endopeptidase (penicillin-binding protein 4)